MKTAFLLKKLTAKISEEQRQYEELRLELLNRYGDKASDGSLVTDEKGMVKMTGDNGTGFVKAHRELLDVEIDFDYIKLDDIKNVDTMSGEDLIVLEGLIQE